MAAKETKTTPRNELKKAPKSTPKETFRFRDRFFKGGIQGFRAQVNGKKFIARFREKVGKDVLSIFNDHQKKYWLASNIKEPWDRAETEDEKDLQDKPDQGVGDDTVGDPEQGAKEDTQEESAKQGQTSFD